MLNLNTQTLIQSKHGIFVIFRNSLNEFWDFCNGITQGISFVALPCRLRLLGAYLFKIQQEILVFNSGNVKIGHLDYIFLNCKFFCSVQKQRKNSGFYHNVIVKCFFWGQTLTLKIRFEQMLRIFHEKKSKFTET